MIKKKNQLTVKRLQISKYDFKWKLSKFTVLLEFNRSAAIMYEATSDSLAKVEVSKEKK